jgi:hypothetical protein
MYNQTQRVNMAMDQTRRLRPSDIQADKDSFAAIEAMPDYAPSNKDYAVPKLQALSDTMGSQQETETQAEAAAKAARDDTTAAEWDFHNAMLAAKKQVVAQYGDDSNEAQAVGLTKKSERSKPARKGAPASDAKK